MATKDEVEGRAKRLCTNIPNELKQLPQWVLFRLVYVKGKDKPKKEPHVSTMPSKMASSSNPATWSTFEQSLSALTMLAGTPEEFDGVMFALTAEDDYVLIDIDELLPNDGRLRWLTTCGSYTEKSVSKKGKHIILKGKLPVKPDGFTGRKSVTHHVEVYDRNQFCVFTGDVVEGYTQIVENQAALDKLYATYFSEVEAPPPPKEPPHSIERNRFTNQQLWDMLFNSSRGPIIRKLYNGDYSDFPDDNGRPDHHRADLALCNDLMFATCDDENQIDSMFRETGLDRGKWDRKDYRERTIQKARATTKNFYQGPTPRADRLEFSANGTGEEQTKSLEERIPIYTLKEAIALPPKEWLVENLFGPRDMISIIGMPGGGKTHTAVDLAMACVAGDAFAGKFKVSRPMTVWYCAGEGQDGLPQRLQSAAVKYRLEDDSRFFYTPIAPQLFDAQSEEAAHFFVKAWQQMDMGKVDLIIIDTYFDATNGMEENSAMDTRVIAKALDHVMRALGCASALVHHTNKLGKEERGSGALKAKMQCMMLVKHAAGTDDYTVECTKQKDAPTWQPLQFTVTTDPEDLRNIKMTWQTASTGVGGATSAKEKIKAILWEDPKKGWTSTQLAKLEKVGCKQPTALSHLENLAKEGSAIKKGKEYYGKLPMADA